MGLLLCDSIILYIIFILHRLILNCECYSRTTIVYVGTYLLFIAPIVLCVLGIVGNCNFQAGILSFWVSWL